MHALAHIIPHRPARPSDFPDSWRHLPPIVGETVPTTAATLILEIVSRCTGIPEAIIKGETRSAAHVKARFICYWLCRERLGWSFSRIGRAVGSRDHTTILNGYRRACAAIAALGLTLDRDPVVTVNALWSAPWPNLPGRPA